jgi:hypothetical protein
MREPLPSRTRRLIGGAVALVLILIVVLHLTGVLTP